jgi:cold shock protein
MAIGIVAKWDDERGFGFIARTGDSDVFVHAKQLRGTVHLILGQKVEFEVGTDRLGRACAISVTPIEMAAAIGMAAARRPRAFKSSDATIKPTMQSP